MKKKLLTTVAAFAISLCCFGMTACGEDSPTGTVRLWDVQTAYEQVKSDGYLGTFDEFIKSLANIKTIALSAQGDLIFTMGDGSQINAGKVKGETGPTGAKGETGNGIESLILVDSEDGVDTYRITFTNGGTIEYEVTNGKDGATGIQGVQGEKGDKGADGKSAYELYVESLGDEETPMSKAAWLLSLNGTDGAKGDKGDQGETGATGAQGEKGETGATGATGAQGEAGTNGTGITRIEKIGTVGNVDTYKIYFTDNTTFVYTVTNGTKGDQGIQGEKGSQGEKGDQGIQGEQGIQGVAGRDGANVESLVKTNTEGNVDTYTMTFSDGSFFVYDVVNGTQGIQGLQGIQGEKGDKGDKGETGATGAAGKSAYELYVESLGDEETPMSKSEWLLSLYGTDGEKGDKGDKGDQGVAGQDGERGSKNFFGTTINTEDFAEETLFAGDTYTNTITGDFFAYDGTTWNKLYRIGLYSVNVKTFEELALAVEESTCYEIHVVGNVAINSNVTLPNDKELIVGETGTLTIAENVRVLATGIVRSNGGQIVNNGVVAHEVYTADELVTIINNVNNSDGVVEVVLMNDILDVEGIGTDAYEAKDVVLDLNGHTLNISRQATGSDGTKTQAFHLIEGVNFTIKNGTLTTTAGSGIKMLIQNYADLTLDNVVVDGRNLDGAGRNYVVSNNCGNVTMKNGTRIIANVEDVAFDAYGWYSAYPAGVIVTLDETCVIDGVFEISEQSSTDPDRNIPQVIIGETVYTECGEYTLIDNIVTFIG